MTLTRTRHRHEEKTEALNAAYDSSKSRNQPSARLISCQDAAFHVERPRHLGAAPLVAVPARSGKPGVSQGRVLSGPSASETRLAAQFDHGSGQPDPR